MRVVLLLAAVSAVIGSIGSLGGAAGDLPSEVRMGIMMPASGGAAGYGLDIMAASKLAVDDFNAYLAGVDAEWRLVPVYVDSFTDPGAVIPGLGYLGDLGVRVVAGPSIDIFGAGAIKFAEERDMFLLSCCSVTLEDSIPGDNMYSMTPNQTNHGRVLADVMYDGGVVVMVPVGRNAAWITDLIDGAVERFAERGGTPMDVVLYDDYGEFGPGGLDRINDMVFEAAGVSGYGKVGVLYVGFEETFELVDDAAGYGSLADVRWFGADANTILHDYPLETAAAFGFTSVQPVALGDLRTMQVAERLNAELGRFPSVYAYQQYDAVSLLGRAIMEGDSTDMGSIAGYLDGVVYDGVSGMVVFDGHGGRSSIPYGVWEAYGDGWLLTGIMDGSGNQLYCLDVVNGLVVDTMRYLWRMSEQDGPDPEVCRYGMD